MLIKVGAYAPFRAVPTAMPQAGMGRHYGEAAKEIIVAVCVHDLPQGAMAGVQVLGEGLSESAIL